LRCYDRVVIRRDRESLGQWWLINQHDHALLSGQLASHLGGRLIEVPGPAELRDRFIAGVGQHDCGWPLHDDAPTLDASGRPRDLFDGDLETSLHIWLASAERAAAMDPYIGLLVSLHSLSLSVRTAKTPKIDGEATADAAGGARSVFELNKFQHRMVELQEELRRKLGFRTDLPLHYGLSETSSDANEKMLAFHFRLLSAMDKLSLDICCTTAPFPQIQPVPCGPGARSLVLNVRRNADDAVIVSPWPFAAARLELAVPYRALPAKPLADASELRAVLDAAPIRQMPVQLIPAHG
jgi:hypothetical protein